MDTLEMAKALFGNNPTSSQNSGQTTTTYGIAVSDSVDGIVQVNLGGDTASEDDDQTIEVETTFAVFEGDEVIVQLVGADGTGKAPCVIGVVGRGDQMQTEINAVQNYFWTDQYGAHVSTEEHSVNGANVLLDSDSLDIRVGSSNSEADQTVLASFGTAVTIGSRDPNYNIGDYSVVIGHECAAPGQYSYAEGYQNYARGAYNHVEGRFCTAYDPGNHVEGYGCQAMYGEYMHVEGNHSVGKANYQHIQGKYNVSTGTLLNNYADVIGNGTSENARSNAYNMTWGGNAEFQGEVYVGGCTPNGETPYPVVRYNTSNSKQEYYDKANSAWAQVPGGGGGWTKIWENNSPSSNYAAQTEAMDLSGYTWVAIIATISTSGTAETTHLVRVGSSVVLSVPNLGSTQYFYKREASVASNGITFGTGYRNNTSTSGTNYCIPVAVYGVC